MIRHLSRLCLFACLLAFWIGPAWALEDVRDRQLQNAATADGDGLVLSLERFSSVSVDVTISGTATVTFEGSTSGTAWTGVGCIRTSDTTGTPVLTTTITGMYQCNVAAFAAFHAPISGCAACTVTVFARATTGSFSKNGGGGGLGAEVQTLQDAFALGKEITGANSEANCVKIGDGTNYGCFYWDATTGWRFKTSPVADARMYIPTDKTLSIYDEEGGASVETVDPDAASTLAMWTYGAAYRPKKQAWLGAGSLDGDGTQCPALATTVTINSGPKIPTFICTENDASTLYGSFKLVENWDAGTITVTHVYIQTAADTGSMLGEVSMQCHGNGETVDSTYGTMVELDDAAVTGSNKNDFITSTAVTPAGTCAAGDMLYFRWQYDGTGNPTTAAATLNHVGFMLKYSETSRSN